MKIVSLKIKNYRALNDISLDQLSSFCVFVGANGSGKSTLFDVFGFLKDALINNVSQALQKRGGFKEVVTRGHENEDICLEIKFKIKILDKERIITYVLEIGQKNNKPIVKREILRYKRSSYGSPFHFLDFQDGKGYAVTNEESFDREDEEPKREEQTLESKDILAIKGLGQFQRFKAASAFRALIENWYVSDFHISAARGVKDASYAEHLSITGDNLPAVAQYLYENHQKIFLEILEKTKKRVPGVSKVEAKNTEDGRLILRFQDDSFKEPFIDRYVSDGTIKMFAYLVLLYDPKPHPFLCVEEPENQLYPSLLGELAEEFEAYSKQGGQVFVSTHSPDFLNAVNLDNIYWLEKKQGVSTISRASDNTLLKKLVEEGDLPGALWKQDLFGSANPK